METWQDDEDDLDEEDAERASNGLGGRDAVLFLLDCTDEMHKREDDQDDSAFEMALRCVQATLKTKIFAAPNDYIGLLLYGTEKSVNVTEFPHLSLMLELDVAQSKSISLIDEHLESYPDKVAQDFGIGSKFALHEALWKCQNIFCEAQGVLASKKIILFTANDDPHAGEANLKRQAIKKAGDLLEFKITLDMIPLKKKDFDPSKFFLDLLPLFEKELLGNVAQKLDDLLMITRKRVHKKRTLARLTFSIGPGLDMAVSTFSFVQKTARPVKVKLTRDTNDEVKMQRQLLDPATGAPLLPSQVLHYQQYGQRKIAFTSDELRAMKAMDGKVGLRLLAFRPQNEVNLQHFVRSCHFMYPDEDLVKGSRKLFATLLLKCVEKKVVPICHYKARESSLPSFVALIPHRFDDDVDYKGFLIFYLPYHDDVRHIPDVGLTSQVSEKQVEVAKKVITKLKLKEFRVEAFENPDLQTYYRLIEDLALQKGTFEQVVDYTLPPFDKIKRKLGSLADEFNETFQLEQQHQSTGAKRSKPDPTGSGGGGEAIDDAVIRQHVREGTLNKLKVEELKPMVKLLGISVSNKKKAQLIEDLEQHYNKVE